MIDIAQLRLEPSVERSLDVPVALPDIIIGGVTYSGPAAPAISRVDITRLISGLLLRMRLSSTITGPCHRCLEEAAVPVSIEAREYQADHPEKGAEAEEVCDYLEGDDLDVATWAAHKILCGEDCAGLCPACGTNLNNQSCTCVPAEGDDRWGALRGLLKDDSDG
jgi:uncharacterized protein